MKMLDVYENSKGAIPKRRNSTVIPKNPTFLSPYLNVENEDDENLNKYMKSRGLTPRSSLRDERQNTLKIPQNDNLQRNHSFKNDSDFDSEMNTSSVQLNRRNSKVKRSASIVSTRSRRGSKYYSGNEVRRNSTRRLSTPSGGGGKLSDFALMLNEKYPTPEEYQKEMKRRRIVWLIIGMFFFILTVSVLIVLITLTHKIDYSSLRKFNQSYCNCKCKEVDKKN